MQMQIGALSAFLKENGYKVKYEEIIISSQDITERYKDKIKQSIEIFRPDLIGFSSYDMNYRFIINCASFIKSFCSKVRIIVGGHHASLAPDDYMQFEAIDYVCIGEGEYVLKELLGVLSRGGSIESVEGLCFRDPNGRVVYNRARDLLEDLDELPYSDRTIFYYQGLEMNCLPIFAGKGCLYACTYCANSSMRRLYRNQNKYVRYRSASKIIDEIRRSREIYKFRHVVFYDDVFPVDYRWLQDFAKLYSREFADLPFHCQLRPEIAANEDYLELLYNSGCRAVSIGVESGSQRYREEMLGRKMSNSMILRVARLVKKYRMKLCIYMMVGLPAESFLDMIRSLWLNFRIGADDVQTAIYYPIKNTPLYQYCQDNGLIDAARKESMYVFAYDSCLNYGILKRSLIIIFKWLNSGMPIIRRFKIKLLLRFFKSRYKKWLKRP
jgi:radical SAM superfamily enzyme YgiQ (UPF0313 family)